VTIEEFLDRVDELGLDPKSELVVHEPEVGFATIEEVSLTSYGQVRVTIQSMFTTEED
jgi:hypothetical protein